MRQLVIIMTVIAFMSAGVVGAAEHSAMIGDTARSNVVSRLLQTPLHFVANEGQMDERVFYYARSDGGTVYCTDQGLVFGFREGSISLKFSEGRRVKPQVRTKLPGKVNYFIGSEPASWRTGISTYSEIAYPSVYPGIDLIYSGDQGRLKYTFHVQPGANPDQIQMRYEGVEDVRVDEATGELVIQTGWGEIRDMTPVAYQEMDGSKRDIDICFRVKDGAIVEFLLGSYDESRMLVLDPMYSTYLGGSGEDTSYGIAVDSSGNAYVTGWTSSTTDFPMQNAYQIAHGGGYDAFVTKFSAAGSLEYSTYLGGSDYDFGEGIAVDGSGKAYVIGRTDSSAGFPLRNAYQIAHGGGLRDAFVAKLSGTGSLEYSTYLGGSSKDRGYGIAVDNSGNIYLIGVTDSAGFPLRNAYQSAYGGGYLDAFVAKFSATGSLEYSTYLGGNNEDVGWGIVVDSSGNAYVTGYTTKSAMYTTGFPLRNAYQNVHGGDRDAFVAKFSATGSLEYSTYLGGSRGDWGYGIAVDNSDDVYVAGITDSSTDFPLRNAYQNVHGGDRDAFVAKFSAAGPLEYSTYLGGSDRDSGISIALDSSGNAYVTGWTESSTDFPLRNAYQNVHGGDRDAFVTKLSMDTSRRVPLEHSAMSNIFTLDTRDISDYKIVSLEPDPNPTEPEVMSSGVCYLYYSVVDAEDKPVIDLTAGYTVNGTSYTSPATHEDGMLVIPVEATDSQPGDTLSVSINQLGATAITVPVTERVTVTTREYEQIWSLGSAVSGKVGVAIGANGYVKVQTEGGILYALDELDALAVARSAEIGAGTGVGVTSPGAKLTIGAAKAEVIAEAGVEAIVYSIFADEYLFADRHVREQQMAQSALLVDTAMRISGMPAPLSTWLVEALMEQVGGSYTEYRAEESVTLGTRLSAGASVSAGAELGTFTSETGQQSSPLAGLSIEGSAGVTLGIGGEHIRYYKDGIRDATGFALNQELGAEVQIGALLGVGEIPDDSPTFTKDYVSLNAGIDYGESGFAGVFGKFGIGNLLEFREEYVMELDGTPREFSLSMGDQVRTMVFTVKGSDISRIQQSVANLAAFIDMADDIDVKVGEQAIANELEKLFEQLVTMEIYYVVKEGPASSFSFPLSLEGNLGLDVGVSYEIEASKSLERTILEGVFLGGKLYPHSSYTDEPQSTAELASIADDALQGSWEIVKELFNQAAESIIEGTRAVIETVAETVEEGAEVVKGTVKLVGTFTRNLEVTVISWFVPAEERSAPAPARAMTAYQQAEARAMIPVVGGYYQFTPEGEPLAEPGELTITYTDEEIRELGISEDSLRISYWHPDESRWVNVGGMIDRANNSVTAAITALHLYAITFDATPPDIGQLTPSPNSIISDPWAPIMASIVDDTGQLDRSSVAMLLDGVEVIYNFQGQSIVHIPVGLSAGEHNVTVRARDLFGNAAEQTWSFILRDPEAPSWDLNSDGIIDISDLIIVAGVFGHSGEGLTGDLNSDGVVDIMDLMIVAIHFGETTNLSAPASPRMANADHVDMVEGWLKAARMANDGSELFQRGISLLERLLNQIIPSKTALMQNYPNPFNPDTWIPYQLSEGADVSIVIYDATGRIVKRLDVGCKNAGVYRTQDRAAHWDGRNEAGESVASGAYFVVMKAGEYQQVRRIVLIR